MPSKIMDSSPKQRIASCLGVDLDDWVSLVGKNMGRVIALPPFQQIHGRLIQRHRMRAAVLVLIGTWFTETWLD